ncbi:MULTISPECIES: cyclic-di-AMP receptor [Anaerotruncus]|uniref:Transcriptional regulator n=1 Tax=Anaerotruncus colihominis TaxID=169435 RepID=A0A845RN85_9FIRM|nr:MULTISPECIES: cyclic-di-AMP receptor [Anaerotruncus]MCI8492506.1 transcriptional regulator [Anaerotruncus sp.]MCR2026971.1 cyclic-di-AMP receptor [Anaerotruncus colihominis]NBI79122.1 transcriptional regulator [Anaerotruncus colihominis]NDO39627.1 transcriptional regulator [Anaerotruncus colihominis]
MKLIFAIVSNDDSSRVSKELTKNKYSVTKLATTGGFLMAGNTTFLIGTDDDRVDDVIRIIGMHSKKRTQMVPSSASYGVGMYTSFPVEVQVGGATVFVTNIERFEKL